MEETRLFAFVLMPFDPKFADLYKFGIKEPAAELGILAERVDEQLYNEGILDRVYRQIDLADIIVAEMTGQNPNVFYEVGYAHGKGKLCILSTASADDIPFDLKHRRHIVHGNSIGTLRNSSRRPFADCTRARGRGTSSHSCSRLWLLAGVLFEKSMAAFTVSSTAWAHPTACVMVIVVTSVGVARQATWASWRYFRPSWMRPSLLSWLIFTDVLPRTTPSRHREGAGGTGRVGAALPGISACPPLPRRRPVPHHRSR
jgi:hypothetical protein